MSERIQNFKQDWTKAIKELKARNEAISNRNAVRQTAKSQPHTKRLKILLHMGLLTKEYGLNFGERASIGGPLGELLQWADLAASLQLLGHELILSWSPERLKSVIGLRDLDTNNCKPARVVDLIFTDLVGLEQVNVSDIWSNYLA